MTIQIEINDCFSHTPIGAIDCEWNFTVNYNCNFAIKEDKIEDFINIIKRNDDIRKVLAFLHYYNGDCNKYLNEIVQSAIDGNGIYDIAQCFNIEDDEDYFDPSWWEKQYQQNYLNNK